MIPIPENGPQKWNNEHDVWEQESEGIISLENNPFVDPADLMQAYNTQTNNVMNYLDAVLNKEKSTNQARAIGNNWSFSKAAATPGYLFQTKDLKKKFLVQPGFIDPNSRFAKNNNNQYLAFLQCGNELYDIHQKLAGINKALPVSGSSCDQTIVGAFSTGPHGSAIHGGGGIPGLKGENWGEGRFTTT